MYPPTHTHTVHTIHTHMPLALLLQLSPDWLPWKPSDGRAHHYYKECQSLLSEKITHLFRNIRQSVGCSNDFTCTGWSLEYDSCDIKVPFVTLLQIRAAGSSYLPKQKG